MSIIIYIAEEIIKITGIRVTYISNLERHSKQLAKRKKKLMVF